jgi:hypothetical protein
VRDVSLASNTLIRVYRRRTAVRFAVVAVIYGVTFPFALIVQGSVLLAVGVLSFIRQIVRARRSSRYSFQAPYSARTLVIGAAGSLLSLALAAAGLLAFFIFVVIELVGFHGQVGLRPEKWTRDLMATRPVAA